MSVSTSSPSSLSLSNTSLSAAIRCEDRPDLTSRGSSYSWNGLDVFSTNITYSCPPGQAFSDNHQTSLTSTCDYQNTGDSLPTWKYNADNPLPDCTGRSETELSV